MIELVFVVCLSIDPTHCRTETMLFSDQEAMVCVMGAQTQLATWSGSHPGWQIDRWTCRDHDTSQASI